MGRYSSDSNSSDYYRKKKSRKNRSSSRSSSSSRYSSKSKKSKKSKKSRRSRSSERSSRHRRSRDRRSSSRNKRSSRHGKHSRRRSRSPSKQSNRSPSYSSNRSRSRDKRDRSRSRDKRNRSISRDRRDRSVSRDKWDSPPSSRAKRRSRSRSVSRTSKRDKRSPFLDSSDLLAKLNKAATDAMSENSKKIDSLFNENQESRSAAINEINAPSFVQKAFSSSDKKDDSPVLAEVNNFVSFNNPLKEEPGCLLHPNLLVEDPTDKVNRWVKKLFQIRQKTLCGEPLLVD